MHIGARALAGTSGEYGVTHSAPLLQMALPRSGYGCQHGCKLNPGRREEEGLRVAREVYPTIFVAITRANGSHGDRRTKISVRWPHAAALARVHTLCCATRHQTLIDKGFF